MTHITLSFYQLYVRSLMLRNWETQDFKTVSLRVWEQVSYFLFLTFPLISFLFTPPPHPPSCWNRFSLQGGTAVVVPPSQRIRSNVPPNPPDGVSDASLRLNLNLNTFTPPSTCPPPPSPLHVQSDWLSGHSVMVLVPAVFLFWCVHIRQTNIATWLAWQLSAATQMRYGSHGMLSSLQPAARPKGLTSPSAFLLRQRSKLCQQQE